MNPWLEQADVWSDFHDRFLPAISDALVVQITPTFIVQINQHLFIHERSAEQRGLLGRGDVQVSRPLPGPLTPTETAPGNLSTPTAVLVLPAVEIEPLTFLEIRDRQSREVITVVELLSPANKYSGPDREQYLIKRRQLLLSRAHLVEIDLLRGGPRMPLPDFPECDYCAVLSRVEDRPMGHLYHWRLREPFPLLPIPLRAPHPSATLDLKAVLDRVYDATQYQAYVYQGQPEPQLSAADLVWAEAYLPNPGG
jgi:hypothetical protein